VAAAAVTQAPTQAPTTATTMPLSYSVRWSCQFLSAHLLPVRQLLLTPS
jgi:hypothetical protein